MNVNYQGNNNFNMPNNNNISSNNLDYNKQVTSGGNEDKFSYEAYKMSSMSLNTNNNLYSYQSSNNLNNDNNSNNNDYIYKNYINLTANNNVNNNNIPNSSNLQGEFNPLNFSISNSGINGNFSGNNTGAFNNLSNNFSSNNVNNVFSGGNSSNNYPNKSLVMNETPNEIKKTVIMSQTDFTDQAQETYNPYESLSFDRSNTYTKPTAGNMSFNAQGNITNNSTFPSLSNTNVGGISKSTFPGNNQFPK